MKEDQEMKVEDGGKDQKNEHKTEIVQKLKIEKSIFDMLK